MTYFGGKVSGCPKRLSVTLFHDVSRFVGPPAEQPGCSCSFARTERTSPITASSNRLTSHLVRCRPGDVTRPPGPLHYPARVR